MYAYVFMCIIMIIKPFDIGIILPALGAVIASFIFAYSNTSVQSGFSIKAEDSEWVFPLDADETVRVSGPLGDTVIGIHGKQAQVLSSPCANQICVASGAVHSQGQWAACLPNRVLLSIAPAQGSAVSAEDEHSVDAATW